jgi:UDP-N-acetylglucosamine acyltransferase
MSKKLGYKNTISSTFVHETAIVSKHAIISPNVEIGPYCIVGDNVKLGSGVKLYSHVYIDGITEIGDNTKIFPFAAIGLIPQDLKYTGEESRVKIGKNNTLREYVTVHGGTKLGRMETIIGDNCLLMVSTHIAHDCIVGNNVVMSNNATIGGHAAIEDDVIIGGLAAIHQFVRVGKYAIIGGLSAVVDDIVPYATVAGDRAKLLGVNTRGLKRHGFKNDDISAVHQAYDMIFKNSDDCFSTRVHRVELEYQSNDTVLTIVKFLKANKVRPICTPSK